MLFSDYVPLILIFALALDALIGDPDWLWRRVSHPVVLIGSLIAALDRWLNTGDNSWSNWWKGIAALGILIGAVTAVAAIIQCIASLHPLAITIEIICVSVLLAQRSLYDHVRRVVLAFGEGGLPAARTAVSMIVGRDPAKLDEAGVARAAIETTAENFSDGVVAPAFWYLVAGLPGIAIYKAVNTADSMIGHRTPRHEAFGWAAARLDDLLNLIPARMSGLLIVSGAFVTGANGRGAFSAMLRDAARHRSPNAGWPEAAMAGGLGLALAGPRHYASGRIEDAWMNDDGRIEAKPRDISRALRLFIAACVLQAVPVAALALL